MRDLRDILEKVRRGELSTEQAMPLLAKAEDNMGFARVDHDRHRRRGFPEVIFCPGKTADQIAMIMTSLRNAGQDVLASRASREQFDSVHKLHPDAVYHEAARMITIDVVQRREPAGRIGVVCAGTSDIPVAEEAALTAERMGARVERIFDVGVAGLHRLLGQTDLLRSCRALVVVAGMEGALPSVVGGLVDCPIVAVPTSIGYGTSMQGVAALLSMLNTCVPGITVVNIDNGFGAGVAAALMNAIAEKQEKH